MDSQTNSRTTISLVTLIIALALAGSTTAEVEGEWVTYSSVNVARRMLIHSDSLFAVTSGGLLIADPNSNDPGKIHTNIDQLGTNDLTDIIVSADGQKWITGNGRLIRFDFGGTEQFLMQDNENNLIRLLCAADDGNFIWTGYPGGLILFDKLTDGGLIRESYTLFGSLMSGPTVNDVLIEGDSIWIATSVGIAVADKRDPRLLKASSAWTSFNRSSNPELAGDDTRRIISYNGQIIVATAKGLYWLDRSPTDTTFQQLDFWAFAVFTDLRIERDTLFVYSTRGSGYVIDSTVVPLTNSGISSPPYTGVGNGSSFWVGLAGGGLYRADNLRDFVLYEHTGLPDNDVVDIALGRDEQVSVAFRRKPMADFVNGQWESASYDVGYFSTKLLTDSRGIRWAGTFGRGLWQIGDSVPRRFDTTNTTLRGNNDPNGKNYIVITGLATDGPHLFTSCFRAYDGNPIAFARLDAIDSITAWGSFGTEIGPGISGITDTFIISLDYSAGYIAAATEANGLFLYYLGLDPFDKLDDTCHHLTEENSFLRSNDVKVVKFAPDSSLWVGTSYGLSRYDRGIDQFIDVNLPQGVSSEITDIDFDARGVLWVSTKKGVAKFDPEQGAFETIHAVNTGLVNDEVQTLALNRKTGDIWFGTPAGLSLLRSSVRWTDTLESALAFPNPFVIDSPDDFLRVNYSLEGTVSVFDIAGTFITDFPAGARWFGTNQNGKPVASGVYLFVIQNAGKEIARGKFLLVRQ